MQLWILKGNDHRIILKAQISKDWVDDFSNYGTELDIELDKQNFTK